MIFLIIVALIYILIILFLIRNRRKIISTRFSLGDGIADDTMVCVIYKGKPIPMTYMEKITIWDNMSREEKRTQSLKTYKAIDKGMVSRDSVVPTSDILTFEE